MNVSHRLSLTLASSCLFVFFADNLSFAQSKAPSYWQDIRPILRKHCTVCHSAKNLREPDVSGGLALDSYAAIRKGTKRPVIEPGKSGASILVQRVLTEDGDKRMP